MEELPQDTLLEIFKYLEMEEISNLRLVSKDMHSLLSSQKFLQGLFQTVLNANQLLEGMDEAGVGRWLTSLQNTFGQKAKELPFWGESTNGGIYGGNLKFWIGKTFMKSLRPNLILSAGRNCHISGCLAQNYHNFLDNLLIAARYHNLDNDFEPVPQEQLSILETFIGCFSYHTLTHLEAEEDIEIYSEAHHKLMQYTQSTSAAIQLQRDQSDMRVDAERLDLIACVFSIELARNLSHPNPAQRLLVMTAPPTDFPNSTAAQLSLFEQGSDFMKQYCAETEITIDCKDPARGFARYRLFHKNPLNILAEVDMLNCQSIKLYFPVNLRPWTNQLCLHFIEGTVSIPTASNISFEYCSAWGVTVAPPH